MIAFISSCPDSSPFSGKYFSLVHMEALECFSSADYLLLTFVLWLGGTFALYSLICQHVNLQTRITEQNTRMESDTNLRFYSQRSVLPSRTKRFLEKSPRAQALVIFIVLFGTCMVIGDGALTPAISG